MHEPKVAIVYLTFATPNWREDIPRAMRSLMHLTYAREQVELICVESRSPNGERVKEWFEKEWMPKSGSELPRITYLYQDEKIGFPGNVNRGIFKAQELGCQYFYLLNEDAEVDPDFLGPLVARAEQDASIAYVQSFILLGQDRNRVNTVGNAYHFLGFGYSNGYEWTKAQAETFFETERKTNPDLEIGYASGAGVLGRIHPRHGPFDEKFFMYHEDTDICLRARAEGKKIVIEPRSQIYHYYEFEKIQVKKNYWVERNRWVLLLSYYRFWTLFVLLPLIILMELGLVGFSLRKDWWREKFHVYRDLLDPQMWRWLGERRRVIQKERMISDRALLAPAVATIEFQGVKNPVLTYIGNPIMKAYWALVKIFIV
jgi:GT2 family glycosyltransferase